VRRYVEAEFSGFGARLFRAYVHPPPPGAAPGTAAVADVYLDYVMGRPKLGDAMRAMLGAPPRAVEDGAGRSVSIRFSPAAADMFGDSRTSDAATRAVNASQLLQPQASDNTSSPRLPDQQASLRPSGSAATVGPGARIAGGYVSTVEVAVDGAVKVPPVLAALAVDLGNKISMTLPKGWSEDLVRQYVEAEFSRVGARVHHIYVHQRQHGSSPCVFAAADVYLDYRMAKPKLAEAIVAMLATPPKTVDDGAGGTAVISFGPTVRFANSHFLVSS
jgi:hypothetical protein